MGEKKKKIQYAKSNKHGSKLTKKDVLKIQNTYTEYRILFEPMNINELRTIQENGLYEGKKLNGARLRALNDTIELYQPKQHA